MEQNKLLKWENILLRTTLNNITLCIENIPKTVSEKHFEIIVAELNKMCALISNANECLEKLEEEPNL